MSREKQAEAKSDFRERVICMDNIPEMIVRQMPSEQKRQYFIWDEILKRNAQLHPELLLPLLKEIFHKEYPKDVRIEFLSSEYSLDRMEENGALLLHSIRADLVIRIADQDIYHFECQIRPDSQMIIRMYEYDTNIALSYLVRRKSVDGKETVLEFPQSVVLYLNDSKHEYTEESMEIRMPNGTYYQYTVPIMWVQDYTLAMIKEKHLSFLIPFLPIRFRNRVASEKNMSARKDLTAFLNECMIILLDEVQSGNLSDTQRKNLIDFLNRSCRYLFADDAGILKEVAVILEPFIKLEREIAAEEATARAAEKMAKVLDQCIKNTVKFFRKEHASKDEITEKLLEIFPLEKDEATEKVDLYWNS